MHRLSILCYLGAVFVTSSTYSMSRQIPSRYDSRAEENEEIPCGNGQAVRRKFFCDGDQDCNNGFDEENCPGRSSLSPSGFICHNGRSIRFTDVCNGRNNCDGGEDERNCHGSVSSSDESEEFYCGNGASVPKKYLCDGDLDCENGMDEFRCPDGAVPPQDCAGENCAEPQTENPPMDDQSYDCENGHTVMSSLVCDGTDDCGNGKDEMGCAGTEEGLSTETTTGFDNTEGPTSNPTNPGIPMPDSSINEIETIKQHLASFANSMNEQQAEIQTLSSELNYLKQIVASQAEMILNIHSQFKSKAEKPTYPSDTTNPTTNGNVEKRWNSQKLKVSGNDKIPNHLTETSTRKISGIFPNSKDEDNPYVPKPVYSNRREKLDKFLS